MGLGQLGEGEEVADRDLEHVGELFQTGDRRRIHASLHQADKVNRVPKYFCKPRLRQSSRLAESGYASSEFLLKHEA